MKTPAVQPGDVIKGLTVLEVTETGDRGGAIRAVFQCDCGIGFEADVYRVRRGQAKRCSACAYKARAAGRTGVPGRFGRPTFEAFEKRGGR